MRKTLSCLLLSLLFINSPSLALQSNEPFSEYSVILDERIYDTEVFDWRNSGDEDDKDWWGGEGQCKDHSSVAPKGCSSQLTNRGGVGEAENQQTDAANQTHLDVEPTSIVNRSVNVINGCYIDSEVDFVIPGAEPFILHRNYISADTDEDGPFGKGWNRNYFGVVRRTRHESKLNPFQAAVLESGGAKYCYGGKRRHTFGMLFESYEDAVTNCGSGMMSARTNIRNNLLTYQEADGSCLFNKSTGEQLTFTPHKHRYTWRLTHEQKPNGNQLDYTYLKDGKLGELCCRNRHGSPLGNLTFEYGKANGNEFVFINSEGKRKVSYRMERFEGKKSDKAPYIVEVLRENAPRITYQYEDKHDKAQIARIIRKDKPDGRFQEIEYYKRGTNWVGNKRIKIRHNDDPDLNRVMLQRAPVGHDATPIITHRYIYDADPDEEGYAGVYDALNHKTDYLWDEHQRLFDIVRYTGTNDKTYEIASKEVLYWGDVDSDQCTFLMARTYEDADEEIQYMRTFKYDQHGNVLADELFGNLTGDNSAPCEINRKGRAKQNGCEHFGKYFTYSPDAPHLMSSMTEGQVTQTFYYKEGTDLLSAKFFSANGVIFKREFYSYDENAILIKAVEDDGDTIALDNLHGAVERHIRYITPRQTAPLGLPDIIEERCVDVKSGEEHLMKRMVHHYYDDGHLRAKDLYDANNCYLCTFAWEYDAHGNITIETDPLGQSTIRRYDANDNKVFEQGPNPDVHKEFVYDFSDRLVRVDEIHRDGLVLSESYIYNYLNQKVGQVDIYGNKTEYVYDDFGRLKKTLLPPAVNESGGLEVFEDHKEYNLFNFPKVSTDFKGNTTTADYTIRGKPIRTVFPDGSVEEMRYNLDGTVRKHTHKSGSYSSYEYDYLKRITFKGTYSPNGELLESTRYNYSTFHLRWEKDTVGHTKSYKYDAAGRLNEVVNGERRMTYVYDSIGRLYKTVEYNGHGDSVCSVQLFDLLDRVIEERREDAEGNLLTRVTYGYDVDGNRTTVSNYSDLGESTATTIYDARHQPVEITDALGNTTHFQYNYDYSNEFGQTVPYSTSADAMGNITENIKDAHGRLASLIQRNSLGELIHRKDFFYDKNGNKCRQEDTPTREPGKEKSKVVTQWTYDCMNRLKAITEAVGAPEQRHTEMIYNAFGQKSGIIKPDGVGIAYNYDFLGRLESQTSTDGSIDYHYGYDRNGNPDRVEDHVNGIKSSCRYDKYDRMARETFLNGLKVHYQYDKADRPTVITFPDGSGVEYVYKGHRLVEVHRLSPQMQREYGHRYLSYDLEDKLLGAELIGKAGRVDYRYDLLGRPTDVLYESWKEKISSYDKVGNILVRDMGDSHGKIHCRYKYDDLYQIDEEKEVLAKQADEPKAPSVKRSYSHDSLYNRVSRGRSRAKFNQLNQLLEDGENCYKYDPNGNMISKTPKAPVNLEGVKARLSVAAEQMTFQYDALDRLVAVSAKNQRVVYLYDAHNRRICKRNEERSGRKRPWKTLKEVTYIYIGQNEIGSYDEEGASIELRLLGVSKGAEIGGAVAVELHGQVYAPLHDHQGNVTALVDANSGKVVEFYRYTAFGEEQIFDADSTLIETSANPWRFSSKRVDTETGFVYFGRRYYEPTTARWVTPDPIGREGGPNLYAYVLNRALTHYDSYGLWGADGGSWAAGYDPIGAAFNWTCTFVQDFTCFVGQTMDFVGHHLVPIPGVRDVLQIGGRVLSGRGFDDYHFAFCGENVWGNFTNDAEPRWDYNPLNVICLIGGILTSAEDLRQMAMKLSDSLGGVNVHYYATASDGLILDLFKAGARCLGMSFGDEVLGEGLKSLDESMGGSQAGGIISIQAHSQGALVLHNSQKKLGPVCDSIEAYTFGGAKMLNNKDFLSAKNYVSERDIVPFISNPSTYLAARFNPRNDINFLKSRAFPLSDHGWNGKTYPQAIAESSGLIRKTLAR